MTPINTVSKLLVELGAACAAYQDEQLRFLDCKRIQADEIWAFCYAKARNVPEDKRDVFGFGDVWTWTALDPDTKLMVSWLVGDRSQDSAFDFMADVASRVAFGPSRSRPMATWATASQSKPPSSRRCWTRSV